ncbi:MAG: hypothetical protein J6D10_02040, partial [Clostridia bacterium]|nr:hypothetical protein [Clostridia bacterium]
HREYLDVDNNEYFTLVRGGTVDPEPDEPDVPVEPGEPDEPTGTPDEPTVPEDAVKIIVGNGYGAAGTTVTVDISIDDIPEPGISSLDLSVDYDKNLLRLVSANDTGLLGGALYSNDISMIPYGLTWNNLENYTVSGVITTLTFEVLEMPDSGEIEVTVINNECATIEEVQVDVVVTNGIISKRLPGDVNEDGKVSQLDVTRLRKYLAGGWDVEINASNADVNGDGKISQLDVTRLRKYLVGGWNVTLE